MMLYRTSIKLPPRPSECIIFAMVVGFLFSWEDWADALWNQCDGPAGVHQHLVFRRLPTISSEMSLKRKTALTEPICDRAVCWNIPVPTDPRQRLRGWGRRWAKLRGRLLETRFEHAWTQVGLPRDRVDVLMYEPPEAVSDVAYRFAKAHASRVWGPDDRATEPVTLPVVYSFGGTVHQWRALPPPPSSAKVLTLVAVSSGAASIPGHMARMNFYERLQSEGLPLELFGRGLPTRLDSRGPVVCKSNALIPARFCLVIENSDTDDRYVSEKLWDALVAWCVPIYFGSRALDRLIPPESFIRLPTLDNEGLKVVRAALADPEQYSRRLDAIAEARQRALGPLRMVEFLAQRIPVHGQAEMGGQRVC